MKKLLIAIIFLITINIVCASTLTQITSDAEDHYYPGSAAGISTMIYTCGNYVCTDVRGGGSETVISSAGAYAPDINSEGEIVYILSDGSYDQVYKYVSGVETQLTTSAYDKSWYADACPDGDTVVYWADPAGFLTTNHIYKVSISTGTETQLTSASFPIDDGPGVNYDGILDCGNTDVVFSRYDGSNWQIAKVPIAGGAVTVLTSNGWDSGDPQWNSDYSKITYWGFDLANSGYATILTMNSDGSGQTGHTGASNYYYPFYCPDGTLYAFRNGPGTADFLAQILPSVSDLYSAVYDYPSCALSPGHDIFFSQNDGLNDQIWQDNYPDQSDPVPEFSTITLLLAALVALGGIFAFRKYR